MVGLGLAALQLAVEAGAAVALALVPVAPQGVPVLAAAGVALLAGLRPVAERPVEPSG